MERTFTVSSTPAGAEIWIDGERLEVEQDGRWVPAVTPATVRFVHYGTRKIGVRMEGYRSAWALQEFSARWWDTFPLDFFAELWPFGARVHFDFRYDMEAEPLPGRKEADAVMQRARDARQTVRSRER